MGRRQLLLSRFLMLSLRRGLHLWKSFWHWLRTISLIYLQPSGKCRVNLLCYAKQLIRRWNPLLPLLRYVMRQDCGCTWVGSVSLGRYGIYLEPRRATHFILERHEELCR